MVYADVHDSNTFENNLHRKHLIFSNESQAIDNFPPS